MLDVLRWNRLELSRVIGRRVRTLREGRGLTQGQLVALIALPGFGRPHLSRLERGCHDPQATTLFNVARGLDVSVGDLFP